MISKRVSYLKNFGSFEEKSEKYYLYGAFLNMLSSEEVCDLIDTDFSQNLLKRKLLNYRIARDLENKVLAKHSEVAEEIFNKIGSLATYHQKEAASVLLVIMFPYLGSEYKDHIIDHFLNSDYLNNNKRAFSLLEKHWDPKYTDELLNNFKKIQDPNTLPLLINKVDRKYLKPYFGEIVKIFDDQDFMEYNFEFLKLRSDFYAKYYNEFKSKIEKYRNSEPISYIDIYRRAGKSIDKKFALKVYKQTKKYRYLPRWFAEMGLWNVLEYINK